MKTDMPMLPIDVAALESGTAPSVHGRPAPLHPGQGAVVACVDQDDLVRFEGEGGLEAPETATPLSPQEHKANESKNL
jgi:hypothetical protein